MIRDQTELVLGRGEVYFDPFVPGTKVGEGERYIGNTPKFRIEREVEVIERYTSYGGKKVGKPSATISETHTIDFTTDHMHMDNLAMWYGDTSDTAETLGGRPTSDTFTIKRGRFYQLGKSIRPQGIRNVTAYAVTKDGASVSAGGNFEVEASSGRLHVLKTAQDLSDGDTIEVFFDHGAGTGRKVASSAKSVVGALRYVATNTYGKKANYYFPQVKITPNGQFDTKTDQWQQITFEAVASNLNPATEQVYVEYVETSGESLYAQALLDHGLTEDELILYDDLLNISVNQGLPLIVGEIIRDLPTVLMAPDGSAWTDPNGNLLVAYI